MKTRDGTQAVPYKILRKCRKGFIFVSITLDRQVATPRGGLLECEPCRRFNQVNAFIWSIKKGRQYALTLKAGDRFQHSGETVPHDDLIGRPDGTMVRLSGGKTMIALSPTLAEYTLKMPRGAQVLYPKDIAMILM